MEVGSIEYIATINSSKYRSGARDIEKANRDIEGSTDKADKSTNKFSTTLQKFATRGVKVAAIGLAGLAATVATMTIKGGISRALNIEDAQAKLKGLGHDAQSVEKIMVSALDSVRGTAYGLDSAATIAASAVAAGVKPGQQLTKYLGTTADAATIAGVSLSEMGSIFNKVQTQQRAYTMEINQLADRGIPIYQWLQKELGVTQEKLRKMVAAGEVDSDTYFKVIKKNIGGAALESGNTTRGAWANMLAALSRIGQQIVQGPIDDLRGGFQAATKLIDSNAQNIVDAVKNIMGSVKLLVTGEYKDGMFAGWIKQDSKLVKVLLDIRSGFIKTATAVSNYLSPKLGSLYKTVTKNLIPSIIKLWKGAIQPLLPVIGTALVVAVGSAIDALDGLLKAATPVFNFLAENKSVLYAIIGAFAVFKLAIAGKAAYKAAVDGAKSIKNAYDTVSEGIVKARNTFNNAKNVISDTSKMIVNAAKVGTAWVANSAKAAAAWTANMAKIVASSALSVIKMIPHAIDVGLAWTINAVRVSFVWVTQELPKIVLAMAKTAVSATVHAVSTSAAWIASAARSSVAWVINELPKIVAAFITTSASAVSNALVTSAAWITSASRTAVAWVVTTLPKIIAAFVAMAASAATNATAAAASWVASTVTTSASYKALSTLIATPMVMPAIAVGAAIAALALVEQAADRARNAVENARKIQQSAHEEDMRMIGIVKGQYERGEITKDQRDKMLKIIGTDYTKRYKGGPVSANIPYLVGENKDGSINDTTELFVPNTSGRIINAKDLQSAIGNNGGITNNIQNVTISSEVDGERWLRRLSGNQEIVSNGLVPTQSYM